MRTSLKKISGQIRQPLALLSCCVSKIVSTATLSLILYSSVYGQDPPELRAEINVVPPSPEVASLTKYLDFPVSYYTGTANVSFPLGSIETRQLSAPVSISYHTAGLKVEEFASWVGAGWSLNGIGVISRVVRGLPDEYLDDPKEGYYHNWLVEANGQFKAMFDSVLTNAVTSEAPVNIADSVAWGWRDTEPDLYVLSAPGISCKFHINKSGVIIPYEATDLTFNSHPFSNPSQFPTHMGPDYEWIITAENGVVYKFKSAERSITYSLCGQPSMYDAPVSFQSSWYLDEISIGDEWIRFEYDGETILYPRTVSETKRIKVDGSSMPENPTTYCDNSYNVMGKRPKRIYSSNGHELTFAPDLDNPRLDLNGSKKLLTVITKFNGTFVSGYKLYQTYFGSNTKLKLDKLVSIDGAGAELNNGHQFVYFPGSNFPSMISKAQDHWGYFNGSTQSSLIPPYKDNIFHVNRNSITNRNPSLGPTRLGALQRITLPTGGYTEFEYGLNTYYDQFRKVTYYPQVQSQNQLLQQSDFQITTPCSATITRDNHTEGPLSYTNFKKWNGSAYVTYTPSAAGAFGNRVTLPAGQYRLEAYSEGAETKFISVEYEQVVAGHVDVGGLRVTKIKHVDPLKNASVVRRFVYENRSTGFSSGKVFRLPILGGYLTTHKTGEVGGVAGTICVTTTTAMYLNLSAHSQVTLAQYQGSHIGYSTVTEILENEAGTEQNGFTVYNFVNDVDPTPKSFPYIPDADLSYKNGKPLSTEVYKSLSGGANVLVKSATYQYTDQTISNGGMPGLNFKQNTTSYCYECYESKFSANYYGMATHWYRLSNDQEVFKGDEASTTASATVYFYHPTMEHLMYTAMEKTLNAGQVYRTEYERHASYPALLTKVERMYNGTKISGTRTSYTQTLPLYLDEWNRSTNSYERAKDFTYSSWKIVKEQNYRTGNGAQAIKSYLWDVNNLMVAEITNADASSCAYFSFDNESVDVSATAKAGLKSHSGSFIVNLPAAGTYRLGYWKKPQSGGTWTYEEQIISSQTTIGTSTDLIDEVRLLPENAMMVTYNYFANGDLFSKGDDNGQTIYYVYDTFGRMKHLKDNDQNVMKSYDYNYKH